MMATRLRLTIHDERTNARLTRALIERLTAQLADPGGCTLVTLEGGAGTFCEGLDLTECLTPGDDVVDALGSFAGLLRTIRRTPHPVVALVDGAALGGGLALAAAADLVMATPRATFGLPEALFGLIPAIAFPTIAQRAGVARARWLALSATTLSAAEASRIGLVDEVAEDLDAGLARHEHRLARVDARTAAHVRTLTAWHDNAAAEDYVDQASALFQELLATAQTRERIARFNAGETPWPDAAPS